MVATDDFSAAPGLRSAQTFASTMAGHMGAPVRRSFMRRTDDQQRTPLEDLMTSARQVAGGRGGRTRLALLLSLWWVSARPDEGGAHTSQRTTTWWTDLLGLPDPRHGARIINANLKELTTRRFITTSPGDPGRPKTVTLLDEHGTGQLYRRPDGTDGDYFRIPEQLWTTGLIGRLSGPALVMYLAMLYHHRRVPTDKPGQFTTRPVWFTARSFHALHGLSEDTRLAGIRDLHQLGVLTIDTVSIDPSGQPGGGGIRRQRRHLTLLPAYQPPLPDTKPHPGSTPETPPAPVSVTPTPEFSQVVDALKRRRPSQR
ncbi:hypothetical protein [Mycobacterium syngnathidarum]|uniref:hypothetical protein n=1 Tax=Mycobacterium syngnathidarum TaxID=1908205 RepID=UPI001042129B|nr:hypothetical protein [Mycobacterium syngnathidarum]